MKKTIFLFFALLSAISLNAESKTFLFLGDSLTDGHGLDRSMVYTSLIQEKFNEKGDTVKVINGGVDGSTTAGGLRRMQWYLKRLKVDTLVIQLGANDGMRGFQVDEIRKNLVKIIEVTREKNANTKIYLAAMNIFPSMGEVYAGQFEKVFKEVATDQKVELIPFFLDGVAGVKEMNQDDGIHPNIKGHAKVADNIWKILSKK